MSFGSTADMLEAPSSSTLSKGYQLYTLWVFPATFAFQFNHVRQVVAILQCDAHMTVSNCVVTAAFCWPGMVIKHDDECLTDENIRGRYKIKHLKDSSFYKCTCESCKRLWNNPSTTIKLTLKVQQDKNITKPILSCILCREGVLCIKWIPLIP